MRNELLISLKKNLKGNLIYTQGILREIIRTHAGQTIMLYYYDEYIPCRVDRQGSFLLNPLLQELLAKLDTDTFVLEPEGNGIFHLLPLARAADGDEAPYGETGDIPPENEAAPPAQEGARQLDLFSVSVPAVREGKQKSASPTPQQVKKTPAKHPVRTPVKSTVKKLPQNTRNNHKHPAGPPQKPPVKPSAKLPVKTPAKTPTPDLSAGPPVKSPGEALLERDPERLIKPVRIQFSSAADERILAAAEKGEADPPADLLLHRNALLLSLSPGFDTLLSLSAVRYLEPLDYQLSTVRHVLKNLRGRALLCDEVGLGKTIEAGLVMMEYLLRGLVQRVLVLTPPTLVEQWQEEMHSKFNLDFITYDYPDFKAHPHPWKHFGRIIASLDTAKRKQNQEQVLGAEYDLVIVDEAHHLKNQSTLGYQLVRQLKKKYILLLTATPVENNLEELFNLITLLLPGQLETASSFKRKYITRGDPLKPKNTGDLKKLVREVMIRNRRSETGVIRVRRRAEVVEVALSPEEMDFYRRLTAFVRRHYVKKTVSSGDGINQFILKTLQREAGSSLEAVLSTLEKLYSEQNLPPEQQEELSLLLSCARKVSRRSKADALRELLRKIPEKVIVFTGFRETQRMLAAFLRGEGMNVTELHGGMRRQEKEEQVKLFAEKGGVMISTDIGSEGRNLQFCRYIVNYDLPWNPMRIEQRIGRLHRLGQEKDVFILNFSAKETVEAYVLELLDAKINMFQLVVGELDMILGSLKEKKDFETIIMEIWSRAETEEKLSDDMAKLGECLVQAKSQYEAIRKLDDRLLGELLPLEE